MSVGNELGPPSCSLVRADILRLLDFEWHREQSCDHLMNVGVSAHGAVVILPPGCVVIGVHDLRDGATQGLKLVYKRLKNTITELSNSKDRRIRVISMTFGAVEYIGFLRVAVGAIRRGAIKDGLILIPKATVAMFFQLLQCLFSGRLCEVRKGLQIKYGKRLNSDLPHVSCL